MVGQGTPHQAQGFRFFQAGLMRFETDAIEQLLQDMSATLDARSLSPAGWDCFMAYFHEVRHLSHQVVLGTCMKMCPMMHCVCHKSSFIHDAC